MALVSECPKNKTEVAKASQKLGCGVDKYGNIQYLCLPKKEKTSLVELCIDRVMGIQDKGTLNFKNICFSGSMHSLFNKHINEIHNYTLSQDIHAAHFIKLCVIYKFH